MSDFMPDKYALMTELRMADKRRDHIRAQLADADLYEKLRYASWNPDPEYKAKMEIKIAKRAARRAKELAEYGMYIRPGRWDDDLDEYQEPSYIEDVGDGYCIELHRHYDKTYNGYVRLPEDHPYIGKAYDYFHEGAVPRPPVCLTYASGNKYGFCYGSAVKPYDYGYYSAATNYNTEMEGMGYISYESMRKDCLKLVEYFKSLV